MRFEWDEAKNRRNLRKHKISFESAKLVFDDPQALTDRDREVDDEERWQTVGTIGGSITVVVALHLQRGRRRRGDPHHLSAKSQSVGEESLWGR